VQLHASLTSVLSGGEGDDLDWFCGSGYADATRP
jgi:hypothetical protein